MRRRYANLQRFLQRRLSARTGILSRTEIPNLDVCGPLVDERNLRRAIVEFVEVEIRLRAIRGSVVATPSRAVHHDMNAAGEVDSPVVHVARTWFVDADVVIVARQDQRRQRRSVVVEERPPRTIHVDDVTVITKAQAAMVRKDDLGAARYAADGRTKPGLACVITHRPLVKLAGACVEED